MRLSHGAHAPGPALCRGRRNWTKPAGSGADAERRQTELNTGQNRWRHSQGAGDKGGRPRYWPKCFSQKHERTWALAQRPTELRACQGQRVLPRGHTASSPARPSHNAPRAPAPCGLPRPSGSRPLLSPRASPPAASLPPSSRATCDPLEAAPPLCSPRSLMNAPCSLLAGWS